MLCYNIGCAKNFDPHENTKDSCRYHPKPPIFHDGRKGWDCCNKFSTDFSTCLNMPGCQLGFHNSEKPEEPSKPQLDTKYDTDVVVVEAPRPPTKKERSSEDESMFTLNVSVTASAKQALQIRKAELAADSSKENNTVNVVNYGTRCNNVGCKAIYKGSESNKDICLYHSGEAIFHEGMKFWSCCARKTSEFDSFMAQEGCTSGNHLWFKERKAKCRYDWFQTGGSLTLTFYAKVPVADSVKVAANGVKMTVNFEFEGGSSVYDRMFTFYDDIEPAKSVVNVAATKVEVVLKKRDISSWKSLELAPISAE